MPEVHFIGSVLPSGIVNVAIEHQPTLTWHIPEIDFTVDFKVSIKDSIVDVECKSSRFDELKDLIPIYIRAFDLARASVEVVAFSIGYGLGVLLEKIVYPDGSSELIVPKFDHLATLCSSYTLLENFDKIHTIVLTDNDVRMALHELIEANSMPHVSLVNCARAMERLRHTIASADTKIPKAWALMRTALQIEEAYLKSITDASTGPRHGKPGHVPGTVTMAVATRSWIIMDRYFHYRLGGSEPLSNKQFPMLTL